MYVDINTFYSVSLSIRVLKLLYTKYMVDFIYFEEVEGWMLRLLFSIRFFHLDVVLNRL